MKEDLLVSLTGISVCYRRQLSFRNKQANLYPVLKDISLEVYQGDLVGIYGAHRTGKSTLLRVLAGIITPNQGHVYIAPAMRICLLSMQPMFNPLLTGLDNIMLKGLYLGMSKKEIKHKLHDIIEFSGLQHHIHDKAQFYSFKMMQYLNFAIVYFASPDLLLIDDVMTSHDQEYGEKTHYFIDELTARNKTVIVTSQKRSVIASFVKKVIDI